ncbi:ATP-binding protein [Nocardia miyunensis]|uniref:ATP-binding protein n=1 Tax=Nocardia miyunensis TaxID=282684 RepID=UPI0008344E05|nr:tetratricopeptide repeat protein [Nocardia miyunensis]
MTGADEDRGSSGGGFTHSELSGSGGDVVQARDVQGGVHFHAASERRGVSDPIPRQLPADIRGFVNRMAELARLDRTLAGDPGEPLVCGVSVITGTAGVGKTSLALRWGHRVRERFPDGQLYVDLRGYDAGDPVTPGQALDGFLRALGTTPAGVPADEPGKAALFRSLLAERRMLVVLDNAATTAQVLPLLPGTSGCLAVVTSRGDLPGLAVRAGAKRLTLNVLSENESVTLLRTETCEERIADDAEDLAELARLCGRLPLALRIAADRAASRPYVPLSDLIADLRDESNLWDALGAGPEDETDVRTVFAWSYRALPKDAATLFRMLSLHPGPEFSTAAVAALGDLPTRQTRYLLDVLVGAHLIEQHAPDRYRFHDLLRAYALDQAHTAEPPQARTTALRRILLWYLLGADAAQSVVSPIEPHVAFAPDESPEQVWTATAPAVFDNAEHAVRWYTLERANLVGAVRAAADSAMDHLAWRLHVVLRSIYMRENSFDDWLITGHVALAAARRAGDRSGEAEVLESLGIAYTQSGSLAEGAENHRAALAIRREIGDRFGEAMSLNGLGLLAFREHDLTTALELLEHSRVVLHDVGESMWETLATVNIAEACLRLDRPREAEALLRPSLAIFRERQQPASIGNALWLLSMTLRELDRPEEAIHPAQEAVDLARSHGNHMWEGCWTIELGAVQQALGHHGQALESYQRAAALHRRIGDRGREAQSWAGAGEVYRELGRPEEAASFHRLAIATHRELDDRWLLATDLEQLGYDLRRAGDPDSGRPHLEEAQSILAEFNDPKATRMRQRIAAVLENEAS